MSPRSTRASATRHCIGTVPGGWLKKVYLCKYEEFIYLTPNRRSLAPESVMPLPPLDCLRFFEAAARHRSFAHAADELDVTPPAVAHRIRMLESHLGAELFGRGRRSVRLNRRGRAYYEEVRRILLDMPHERGCNAEGPFERSLSKVTDDREAVSQVMHEEPFHFVRIHPGSDPVDRPHQFPESMQRPRLVGFPELAESENVNEVAPPHRNCLQPGPVGSRRHSLLPGEGRRPLSFTPPAMSAREAAPETGA